MKKLITTLFVSLALVSSILAAPTLNSYPTAKAVLYLDFDGHEVKNSMWNNGNTVICAPVIMADDKIMEIFNRVAEDFRPFNLNVTTDLAKFLAAPLDKRMRVVITPTSAWYPSVAGIAYITSFVWGDDTPCFVFSDRLTNDPRRVAETISHESGHTMGLSHQANFASTCTLVSSYHTGAGSGITSWGPIMGNAASRTLTQWNFGPTPNGCSIKQDNLDIITTKNGFGYRPDDAADTYSNAIVVNVAKNEFSREGVISTSSDKDFFRFDLAQKGNFRLNVEPFYAGGLYSGANLDVRVELQDSKGNTIRVYDPKDSLNARIDTVLNSGSYFVVVDGAGNVNAGNNYGSLGSYTMTGYYDGITNMSSSSLSISAVVNSLNASKVKEGNLVSWASNTTKTGESITILYSVDESVFRELARPENNKTSYLHAIKSHGVYSYKLQITEKNGVVRFSNMVTVDASAHASVFKVIKQAQQPITINASDPYEFRVIDNNGRIIQAGKASAGTKSIDIRNLPAGIYNLQLMNDKEQRVERFMNR
jgi:hypothetical protein